VAALPLLGASGPILVIQALFVLKVVYAFAVDHTAPADSAAPVDGVVLRTLSERDRRTFVDLVAEAFASDPLYVAVLRRADAPLSGAAAVGRRAALTGFLFDMNRIVGGTARGMFVDGRLVGAALTEAPTAGGVRGMLRLLAAAVWFLPLALRLGGHASALLNAYFRATRRAAPAGRHHYLVQIAVRADRRGQGLGRRLVEDAFELVRADPASEGLALDTENPHNVDRYRAWGFQPRAPVELGPVTAYTMFRPRVAAQTDQ
jgi:GNAT superfamily N-acetyltransferase